ncbi:MAG TPA: hypothetical protein VM142_13730 [Acidimicrobiales bacterium]|nr:hypothetical protein [Acidimicrobiales bacterium]
MAKDRDLMAAAELDELSPSERAQAVREGLVKDLDQLPESFRRRLEDSARRLSAALNRHPGGHEISLAEGRPAAPTLGKAHPGADR